MMTVIEAESIMPLKAAQPKYNQIILQQTLRL